jgi:hypothetical protein
MAYDFPSSPTAGQRVVVDGRYYLYDGESWTTKYSDYAASPVAANPFKYRAIYTRGYVACGYKNGSPWRNINRCTHSNDTTTNLGDQISSAAAYIDGGFSDYYFYIWGGGLAYSAECRGFSMVTEVGRTNPGTWNLPVSKYAMACLMNPGLSICYIAGGGNANTNKFNMATEVMLGSSMATMPGSVYEHSSCFYGETRGWYRDAYGTRYFTWANETWVSYGGSWAASDGIVKALPTKEGYGYQKNGGNVATAIHYQLRESDGTVLSTNAFTDPNGANGEENYHTGQDKGYCLGQYNGAQNNLSWVLIYATNTPTAGGAAMQPKGHDGMSSAANSSASAQFTGGY